MPNKLMFVLLMVALLVGVLAPATAWAQTPPSDLVVCVTAVDDQGNASYSLAWGNVPEPASLYLFRGTEWVLETEIGQESGVYPLDPGFFPWMVPSLGLEGTCGFLENPPTFSCSWKDDEFVVSWSGLTAQTRLDVLYGNDFMYPYYIGPLDGFIPVGNSPETYWFAPGFALEGGCTRGTNQVFLPVVKNH